MWQTVMYENSRVSKEDKNNRGNIEDLEASNLKYIFLNKERDEPFQAESRTNTFFHMSPAC